MPPSTGEADYVGVRVELRDRLEQPRGLPLLVDHDRVARAPPELKRHVRERDRADVGQRAAQLVGEARPSWRSAEPGAGERPQRPPEPTVPDTAAVLRAREPRKLVVLQREVDDRIEGRRAGEEARVTGYEQQGLLPPHAPTDGVDVVSVDVNPGKRQLDDLRHS